MFEPAVVPLEAYRNGVLRTQITLSEDNGPKDLTGYELKMQVRLKPDSPVLAAADSLAPSEDGSVITLITPTTGVFEIFLSNLDFADIVFPPNFTAGDALLLVYDILFKVPVSGDLLPLVKGSFKVYAGITIND